MSGTRAPASTGPLAAVTRGTTHGRSPVIPCVLGVCGAEVVIACVGAWSRVQTGVAGGLNTTVTRGRST